MRKSGQKIQGLGREELADDVAGFGKGEFAVFIVGIGHDRVSV